MAWGRGGERLNWRKMAKGQLGMIGVVGRVAKKEEMGEDRQVAVN